MTANGSKIMDPGHLRPFRLSTLQFAEAMTDNVLELRRRRVFTPDEAALFDPT
jgi:hypothetical protein